MANTKANAKLTITFDEWTELSIKELLASNPQAVLRAILAIYNAQEDDEKMMGVTKHENGVGFSSWDAEFLTKCAIQLKHNKSLNAQMYNVAKAKMFKYAKQLKNIANSKEDLQGRWNV